MNRSACLKVHSELLTFGDNALQEQRVERTQYLAQLIGLDLCVMQLSEHPDDIRDYLQNNTIDMRGIARGVDINGSQVILRTLYKGFCFSLMTIAKFFHHFGFCMV